MHLKLDQLKIQSLSLIKSPSIEDATILARLAPVPAKLQQLETRLKDIEDETSRIENLLNELSRGSSPQIVIESAEPGRREQKKIRIEIDWSQLGLPGGLEIISEHKASDSLVEFLTRLYKAKGIQVLERLSKLQVNRGFFVSKNPEQDYRYHKGGAREAVYYNQTISNSGFFVLTQSETKQKVSDIRKAWHFLNFPPGALKITDVDKYEL